MKNLFAFSLLAFMISTIGFAQEIKESANGMNEFLSKNIKYPADARANELQGTVILQANFDEKGQLQSSTLISGDPGLAIEVERTFMLLKENWKREFLDEKSIADSYLMSFQFKIYGLDASGMGMSMNDQNSAKEIDQCTRGNIKYLSGLMESNPYDFKLYEQRADLYNSLNLSVLAEKDQLLADYFKSKLLTQVVIVGYAKSEKSISE